MSLRALILCAITSHAFSASPVAADSPRARLRTATEPCRSQFDEETLAEAKKIDDVRNGYVHISGAFPTCGCTCESTAAAFTTASGATRILAYHELACEWESALTGDWENIVPKDILREFGENLVDDAGNAVFYVEPLLPRRGTDLELRLKPLPLGMRLRCDQGVCLRRSPREAKVDYRDESEAQRRHAVVKRVKWERIVLRWNRQTGKFEIKKRVPPKQQTLREYEHSCPKWAAVC